MWMLLKKSLLALFLGRTFGSVLVALVTLLAPIAGILKLIGLPILFVLMLVLAPVLLVLAVIGLPIALIVMAGVVLMGVLGTVLSLSVALLKVLLPIILVVLVVRFVWRLMAGRPRPDDGTGTGPVVDAPTPDTL
jgi:hypothetical protein